MSSLLVSCAPGKSDFDVGTIWRTENGVCAASHAKSRQNVGFHAHNFNYATRCGMSALQCRIERLYFDIDIVQDSRYSFSTEYTYIYRVGQQLSTLILHTTSQDPPLQEH